MTLVNEDTMTPLAQEMLNFGDNKLRKMVIDANHAADYADKLSRLLDSGDEDAHLFGDYREAADGAVDLWDMAVNRYNMLTR